MNIQGLGALLKDARNAKERTIAEVAAAARCSVGYVHKLESDIVQTPSPRVLQRLAETLGLPYHAVMKAAGYDPPTTSTVESLPPKDNSNAHIVQLLREIKVELASIRATLRTD